MAVRITTSGIREAREAIEKALNDFMTKEFVTIGIHEDAGQHESDNITNAQLGAIQEFGTEHIPARPWLNPGVQSGNAEYIQMITEAIKNQSPLKSVLEQVGVVAVGKAQLYMTQLKTPPNAASTIKRKGSSNPLIDTGALRQSVSFKVVQSEPTEGL